MPDLLPPRAAPPATRTPRRASPSPTRAFALIEPGREPLLELAIRHVLIWFLNDCGMPAQALDLLERARPIYRQCKETEPQLMLAWLEARIRKATSCSRRRRQVQRIQVVLQDPAGPPTQALR